MIPTDLIRRDDLACPRCGGVILEKPQTSDFKLHHRFSCVNYWQGTGDAKCWLCASPLDHLVAMAEQLDLFT